MHLIQEDMVKAARALKRIIESNDELIEKLPPVERLLAKEIRKAIKGDQH